MASDTDDEIPFTVCPRLPAGNRELNFSPISKQSSVGQGASARQTAARSRSPKSLEKLPSSCYLQPNRRLSKAEERNHENTEAKLAKDILNSFQRFQPGSKFRRAAFRAGASLTATLSACSRLFSDEGRELEDAVEPKVGDSASQAPFLPQTAQLQSRSPDY